jgi:hypothetical protein
MKSSCNDIGRDVGSLIWFAGLFYFYYLILRTRMCMFEYAFRQLISFE